MFVYDLLLGGRRFFYISLFFLVFAFFVVLSLFFLFVFFPLVLRVVCAALGVASGTSPTLARYLLLFIHMYMCDILLSI